MRRLYDEIGVTNLFVTHGQEEALEHPCIHARVQRIHAAGPSVLVSVSEYRIFADENGLAGNTGS